MCGIIVVLQTPEGKANVDDVSDLSRMIRHRGPDYSGMAKSENGQVIMAHERLAIVDPESKGQPFKAENGDLLAVNGEIYNHMNLRVKYPHKYKTNSDCEVLISDTFDLIRNPEAINELDGMFAFCRWSEKDKTLIIGRDPIGIIPLYYGFKNNGTELWIASELKVLEKANVSYKIFPPKTLAYVTLFQGSNEKNIITIELQNTKNYEPDHYPDTSLSILETQTLVRKKLKNAVKKQLMSDVPYATLLSGGLDSSIITSLAVKYSKEKLHTFSIGLSDSPDLIQAKKVADFLGTIHHQVVFTLEEGINALRDVIWHTETYDVTTIRASTPMFLLSKRIKSFGIKMVLSGEGSDELFGGYLYFHKCKNPEDFYLETIRKVQDLHKYDCLRANKSTAAAGLEVRPPFLDIDFVNTALNINPEYKLITPEHNIEKWILRSAFDNRKTKYLPDEILWRQKEQFSDAVGYSWIDGLKDYAEQQISDFEFSNASKIFNTNIPKTKEAFYYRKIFEHFYPSNSAINTVPYCDSVACSSEKALEWDDSLKNMIDPSGRSVNVHNFSIV